MKDTNEVFDAIEELAQLSGNAKQARLEECLESELFERVVVAAYCPFTTYGVKKYKRFNVNEQSGDAFTEDTWLILQDLSLRVITGHAAIQTCSQEYERLDLRSAELFDRILKKDLRAGFSASSINKAKPGTITVFKVMLAQKYEQKRIKEFPVAVETKLDGVRAIAMRVPAKTGPYRFFSRTGKEFEAYRHLGQELEVICGDNCLVFDGEVVDRSGSFNETVGAAHRKGQAADNAVYSIFDVHYRENFDEGVLTRPYTVRKQWLKDFIKGFDSDCVKYHPHYLANSHEEIMAIYQNARDNNLEGLIVKPLDGKYEKKRSFNWMKIKDQQTVDLQIVGFEPGTGKFSDTLGAIIVDYNGTAVNVGSGLSDNMREEIWNSQALYLDQLIEVEFHEETADGSLRHPRFVRIRDDKPLEDGAGV